MTRLVDYGGCSRCESEIDVRRGANGRPLCADCRDEQRRARGGPLA